MYKSKYPTSKCFFSPDFCTPQSFLCLPNLSEVCPSGNIDIMMERSNRTRGAFVSTKSLESLLETEEEENKEEGETAGKKIYTERETTKDLV